MNTKKEDINLRNIPEKIREKISKELMSLLESPKYQGFYLENITTSDKEASVSLHKKSLSI